MPRTKAAANTSGNREYINNGVSLSPAVPTAGDNVKVVYDGLLSKSGAEQVYARIGYGNGWDNPYDYKMTRAMTGFEATVPVTNADTLNICFKDSANNWDNNSGMNYVFDITQ